MAQAAGEVRPPRYRWVICGLLFLATGINYVDRQANGLLKPTLDRGRPVLKSHDGRTG